MAKTLRLNLGKISSSAQTTQKSVSQAGMVGRELAQLGQTIGDTGRKVGSLVERRRAEEARDQITTESARDKIETGAEIQKLKEEHRDRPFGYKDALTSAMTKRHNKVLKNVTNELARKKLTEKFELERLDASLKATTHERAEFTALSKRNILLSAEAKAQFDYQEPQSEDEFALDLQVDLQGIDSRDISDAEKEVSREKVVNIRTTGIVNGYMKGGSLRDFSRARSLVKKMGDNLTPTRSKSLMNQIDNEQLRVRNAAANNERLNKIALKKQFDNEKFGIRTLFNQVADNPDADVSDQLKGLRAQGKIRGNNFRVTSKVKMNEVQVKRSNELKNDTLEAMAGSTNPLAIRDHLYSSVVNGEMSVEDAQDVFTSLEIRTDSKFATKQFQSADRIIKDALTQGFGLAAFTDKTKKNALIMKMNQIVRDHGHDPVTVARSLIKEEGKLKLSSPTVPGLKGNQNTLEGLKTARESLKALKIAGKIDNKKMIEYINTLKGRERALQEVPTIDELTGKGK